MDLPENRFHLREQVVGRISPEILDTRLIEAESVPQFFGGGAQGGVDVAGRQPVHRQGVDDAHRHRLVRRPGERLLYPGFQHLAALDDVLDVCNGPERRVVPQVRPVAVIGDQAGAIGREFLIEQPLHRERESPEDLALLDRGHPLEGVDVLGVDREQIDVLVHALVHAPVESRERCEIRTNLRLLLTGLP